MLKNYSALSALTDAIVPTQRDRFEVQARNHLDTLTKPKGSLGQLEDIATQIYTIFEGETPLGVEPALLIVAAADHGVYCESICSQPQEITHQMVLNIAGGGAAISVLARHANMDMIVLDAGHKGKCVGFENIKCISYADESNNIAIEAAMTKDVCEGLILAGANEVCLAKEKGYKLISIGEMGIGNTTPATSLYCALYGLNPTDITGPGAGLSQDKIPNKVKVIQQILDTHKNVIKAKNPLEILAHVGGFEIAALCGVVLGAAAQKLPVLIDGFISTAAYVVAVAINPHVRDYAILSHVSAEPGFKHILDCLKQKPILDLGMRLGEGTGCALAYPLVQAALRIYNEMATFESASVTHVK